MPFDLAPAALRPALEARGYTDPTPVQAAVLAPGLAGRDLLVSAQTGSGKTVGFGLAIAPEILEAEQLNLRDSPLALVIAPTRELATQVQRELGWLYAPTGARTLSCVGGDDIRRQLRGLFQGATIVVGTPGRLRDLNERGALNLSKIRAVVLDEADQMLDLGFREELEALLEACPAERHTLLFSATLPDRILSLAGKYQKNAARVEVKPVETQADIQYQAMLVAPEERDLAVVNVLRHVESKGALVFVATREGAHHLHARLVERGFEATALSGDYSQPERDRSLMRLREGRARVLVATDVAARGLDIPDLGLVIHADLPLDAEILVHRSGRTGRAGRKGQAVLLVPPGRRGFLRRLLHDAKLTVAWNLVPSADDVHAQDQERLFQALSPSEEPSEDDRVVARRLLAAHDPEALVAELVRASRARAPEPEDLPRTEALEKAAAEERNRPRTEPRYPREQQHRIEGVWFKIDYGRRDNAAPAVLLPLICRRGAIDRRFIGSIRVLEGETHFEVHPAAAMAFEAAARRPDRRDPTVRIRRLRPGD